MATQKLEIAWPLEALSSIARGPKHRMAVVISVQDADDAKRRLLDSGLAVSLARAGVELFVLVGQESEQVHDALDWVLEEVGAEDVVTCWNEPEDTEDVAAFIAASSRASELNRIVAVIDESTRSGTALRDSIAKALTGRFELLGGR